MSIRTKTILKQLSLALLLALSVFALAACDQDGPMENAGEEIDEAVEGAGDNLEEAGDEIEDEIDDLSDG